MQSSADRCVYLRVINSKNVVEFYSFILDHTRNGNDGGGLRGFNDHLQHLKPSLKKIGKKKKKKKKLISPRSSCVAVGSTIYCIGDGKSTLCFDTTNAESQWEEVVSKMCNSRTNPQTAVVEGKIYVMGGTMSNRPEPWVELFDPESNTWYPLCSPLPKPEDSGLFSAVSVFPDHSSYSIVLGSIEDNFTCLYNVSTQCWEKLDGGPGLRQLDGGFGLPERTLCVGTRLFWFNYSKLFCYDIIEKWSLSAYIEGLENILSVHNLEESRYKPVKESKYEPVLLHDGGCAFYLICCEDLDQRLTLLHSVKFQILNLNPSKILGMQAVAVSCQTFLIHTPLQILDAVLI